MLLENQMIGKVWKVLRVSLQTNFSSLVELGQKTNFNPRIKEDLMFRFLWITLLFVLISLPASADTVYVEASRDNTLIEDPDGALSNGAGPAFFAGRTNQLENSIRRGVIHFEVADALPRNAIIESVYLTLHGTQANDDIRLISLHRLLDDWGEAGSSRNGGAGAPAEDGDATWLHTFYDDFFWVHEGGQFIPSANAIQEVGGTGSYTWGSTPCMVGNVRQWLKNPQRNFGWLIMGDESEPQTAKRFDSRENENPDFCPLLEINYRLPAATP
jgi:hypothetical protein